MQTVLNKNLAKYIVPSVLGTCSFFLFTIVDGIFVGRAIGANAIGALNLGFPFIMSINAFFMLVNMGGITIAAIRFGRGDKEGANDAFMHALSALISVALILCVAGVFFTKQIVLLLGATDTYYAMLHEYLFWYSLFIIPSGLCAILQGFCRNDGSPVLVSVSTIIATSFNVAGDWFLIFPLHMGLKGAAIATGISQALALVIVLSHYVFRKGNLYFRRFQLNADLFIKIVKRGLPETIAQFAVPVSMFCTNYVLLASVGNIGLNSYALISYIASFSAAVYYGASEGLQPLFGQNYGAKNLKALKYYFHAGLIINIAGSVILTAVMLFPARRLFSLFGPDAQTLDFAIKHVPRYCWGFIIESVNLLFSSYFYSTKRTKEAFIMNALRGFIFNTLAITLLPRIFGGGAIWFAFGIYEFLVFLTAVILLKKSEKNGIVWH
jgi:putative MATE family efflux protein